MMRLYAARPGGAELEGLIVKVNFKQTLRQLLDPNKPLLDGEEPLEGVEDQRKPVELKVIAMNALMAVNPDEKIDGAEKVKRYDLALRIARDEEEFAVEDTALVKKLIGDGFGPLIVGQAYKMLEGEKVVGSVLAK